MIECLETGLVYTNPQPYLKSCQAFHPTLVSLGNGEILCSFDLGEAVESLDYCTHLSRSTDNGNTWHLQGPLLNTTANRPATHSVRITRLSDNTLTGFGARFYRDDPTQGIVSRKTNGFVPMDLFLTRSNDAGRTWSPPEPLHPPIDNPAFEICHAIVERPDGTWLAPTATARGHNGTQPAGEKALIFHSANGGRTWPSYGITFEQPGITHWEQSVVSLEDGKLLAVAWAHDASAGKNLPTSYVISTDGGHTFSSPRPTGLNGQTCKLLALPNHQILCVYRRTDKPGLWANLAHLDGDTWHNLAECPLWGTNRNTSGMDGKQNTFDELSGLHFGYPTLLALNQTEVLIAFWCLEGWTCNIRWIKIQTNKKAK